MTDQRAVDQLVFLNARLVGIEKKVNEMHVYVKSIAESLAILAKRGMVIKVDARS